MPKMSGWDFLDALQEQSETSRPAVAIVSAVFRKAGFTTFEARNGDEVLSQARHHKPNIIVLDLQMGSRGGQSAIDELLLDPDLVNIPVIVLSGEKDPAVIEQVKSNPNVIDYITKDSLPEVTQKLERHAKSESL